MLQRSCDERVPCWSCVCRKTLRALACCLLSVAVYACDSVERRIEAGSGPTSHASSGPAVPDVPVDVVVAREADAGVRHEAVLPSTRSSRLALAGHTEGIRSLPVLEQQAALLRVLSERGGLGSGALSNVRAILEKSEWLSFGNPKVSRASMSREECWTRRAASKTMPQDPSCGAPNMVRLQGPGASDAAGVCIDQYEFPNLECEYPLVWVRSSEAAGLCAAVGKRLCDAHEWEGACAGSLLPVEDEYPWGRMSKGVRAASHREQRLWLEYEHNRTREIVWAYGKEQDLGKCATGAQKDARCDIVDWGTCGSNTYPAGAFPECVSPFGVYDLHGNVAEHMNLPLNPSELTSRGGLGWTEMKGSWFIFATKQTHPDDCRWRAKSWHTTRIGHAHSHRNYHLGFRCCKSVPRATP